MSIWRIDVKNNYFKVVSLVVAILPVALYYWIITRYTVNIPYWDDYTAIIEFLLKYEETSVLSEKLQLVFSQHNEHRIAFSRIIFLLQSILGGINFKTLVLIGNFAPLLIVFTLYAVFKQSNNQLLYFLPVTFIFFQFQFKENSLWAMASITNFYVIAFVFLCIYFLAKNTINYFFIALLFAIAATFTAGNGMFVFFVGCIILFTKKSPLFFWVVWITIGIISIICYFNGYTQIYGHTIASLKEHPDLFISYFFSFLGSGLYILDEYGFFAAVFTGLLFVVLFLYLVKEKYYKYNPTLFSLLVFLFMSAGVTAVSRSTFGVEQAFSSRYTIYSLLLISCFYIAFQQIISQKYRTIFGITFLAFSIYLNYFAYNANIKDIKQWSMEQNYGIALLNEGHLNARVACSDNDFCKILIDKAAKKGLYNVPDLNYAAIASHMIHSEIPQETNNILYSFAIEDLSDYFLINNGWSLIKDVPSSLNSIYVVLKSEEKVYVFETIAHTRPDVTTHFNSLNYDNSGFSMVVPKKEIVPGDYTIGILILRRDGITAFQYTDQHIHTDEHLVIRRLPFMNAEELKNSVSSYFDEISFNNKKLTIRGWALAKGVPSEQTQTHLMLISNTDTLILEPPMEERGDVTMAYKSHNTNYNTSGFYLSTSVPSIEPDLYTIYLRIKVDSIQSAISTDRTILVK